MGLYFCLQESIFFRLESFLWFPNLAAPDMLLKFGEGVPWISEFSSIGGSVYLGPYLNILPLIAVSLMFVHQKMTLPPPTDEQQEMQQRMMKIMMIVMAVFFYKMAAGMCLYFIASTAWGLTERKLIKRKNAAAAAGGSTTTLNLTPTTPNAPSTSGAKVAPAPQAPSGGFLARLKAKMEEIQQKSDTTRQIRNEPKTQTPPGGGQKPNGKKKKKK
jgi:YidC/Oxa1 family membrane protein insertase